MDERQGGARSHPVVPSATMDKAIDMRSRGKLARPKLLVHVVVRDKCYLIFQLTITITVDISVDSNNCPYTGQLLKWEKEEVWVPPLTGLCHICAASKGIL